MNKLSDIYMIMTLSTPKQSRFRQAAAALWPRKRWRNPRRPCFRTGARGWMRVGWWIGGEVDSWFDGWNVVRLTLDG